MLSTVGGVRFIKWAQDFVSFVKCEPPSILRGDKHYNAFKDVLALFCFFCHWQPGMAPQAEGYVILEDPTSQPLKSSLTLKGKSFLHSKRVGDRLYCIHLVRCLLI